MKSCRSCLRPLKPGFGCKHCARKAGKSVIHRAVALANDGKLSDEKLAQLDRIIAKRMGDSREGGEVRGKDGLKMKVRITVEVDDSVISEFVENEDLHIGRWVGYAFGRIVNWMSGVMDQPSDEIVIEQILQVFGSGYMQPVHEVASFLDKGDLDGECGGKSVLEIISELKAYLEDTDGHKTP